MLLHSFFIIFFTQFLRKLVHFILIERFETCKYAQIGVSIKSIKTYERAVAGKTPDDGLTA